MNANKLNQLNELITEDHEDRLIETPDGWYRQTRGTSDAYGPYATPEEAAEASDRKFDDFT